MGVELWAKPYGIRTRVIFETSCGTNLGTHWEPFENLMGIHWEQGGKKTGPFMSALPSHWLHEISVFKTIHHQF